MKKKLTDKELEDYKKKLTLLRDRLRGDVHTMTDSAMKKNRLDEGSDISAPTQMAEAGSDNFEQEFTLSLMESGAATLRQINEALARIDDKTYGICSECGEKIPKKRLEAIPYATKCVQCVQNSYR